MKSISFSILFSLALFSYGQDQGTAPKHHNFKGQIIRSYAVNPHNSKQMLVGLKGALPGSGRVHLSNDNGATWTELNEGKALCDSCADVQAVCFVDEKTYLAGTWKNGLFLSKDAGKSFKKVKGFPAQDIRAIKKSPSGIVYAATTTHGIMKTDDNGKSWMAPHSPDLNKTLASWTIEIAPTANNILYALTFGDGIHKSMDAGATWKRVVYEEGIMIWDIDFVNNEIYAVGSSEDQNYLFHAYMGDKKWKTSKLKLDASVNSISIQSGFLDYNILLGTWDSGIHKTYAIESSVEGYRCIELDDADTIGVAHIMTDEDFIYNFSWGGGLKIYEREKECAVMVPEIYHPDSENGWSMRSTCKLDHMNFKLYDRWGERLYESNGTIDSVNQFMSSEGSQLKDGVYVYWMKTSFEDDSDTLSLKGHISILK